MWKYNIIHSSIRAKTSIRLFTLLYKRATEQQGDVHGVDLSTVVSHRSSAVLSPSSPYRNEVVRAIAVYTCALNCYKANTI